MAALMVPLESISSLQKSSDFIEVLTKPERSQKEFDMGIYPITNGVVIDHIARGNDYKRVWDRMFKVRTNLGLNVMGAQGVYPSKAEPKMAKGLMSLPNFDISKWNRAQLK